MSFIPRLRLIRSLLRARPSDIVSIPSYPNVVPAIFKIYRIGLLSSSFAIYLAPSWPRRLRCIPSWLDRSNEIILGCLHSIEQSFFAPFALISLLLTSRDTKFAFLDIHLHSSLIPLSVRGFFEKSKYAHAMLFYSIFPSTMAELTPRPLSRRENFLFTRERWQKSRNLLS